MAQDKGKDTPEALDELQALRRRVAELEEAVASLAEKETLLREVHHRVRNNFQVIISMIDLQSDGIEDARLLGILQDVQNRVRAMATIHEKLHPSVRATEIEIAEYARDLVKHLSTAYGRQDASPRISLQAEAISLKIETALPCSLILYELLSNALKYAFPDGRDGEIRVSLKAKGKRSLMLSVHDNGVGVPKDVDVESPTSLGLQLVRMLTAQLGGQFKMKRSGGTEFTVRIPLPKS
ncbi:MAG: sensor histidine kinase [Phycisphaerae bacterium]|nr:sensor histidine kinase [Phycisphaerae bacterium]